MSYATKNLLAETLWIDYQLKISKTDSIEFFVFIVFIFSHTNFFISFCDLFGYFGSDLKLKPKFSILLEKLKFGKRLRKKILQKPEKSSPIKNDEHVLVEVDKNADVFKEAGR